MYIYTHTCLPTSTYGHAMKYTSIPKQGGQASHPVELIRLFIPSLGKL